MEAAFEECVIDQLIVAELLMKRDVCGMLWIFLPRGKTSTERRSRLSLHPHWKVIRYVSTQLKVESNLTIKSTTAVNAK